MHFRFNVGKAIQAAHVLLELEGGRMSYFRLLKLLYIADRESIMETGLPITFAHGYALRHGPIPSEIYDLVKGSRTEAKQWEKYFRTHGYQVSLESDADPGRGKLSRYEIQKLREIVERFEPLSDFEIAERTHEFKEYEKNQPEGSSSNPIPFTDILDAMGMSKHKDAILADLRTRAAIDELVETAND
jgi:uncharacterized phage-associated protein